MPGASRTSSVDSADVIASGFSRSTCFPARNAAAVCSKWNRLGVVRCTAETESSRSSSPNDSYPRGRPSQSAAAFDFSGDEPTMPVTCTPARRRPSTWTGPMNPVPTTAAERLSIRELIGVFRVRESQTGSGRGGCGTRTGRLGRAYAPTTTGNRLRDNRSRRLPMPGT